ncbi:MAG: hypothetical protein MUF81_12365 [Verrucomicrobia bacterium]|jgi:hypothetical protein|nr:hypothetical protein [Verrucomicrobiota bacterium]
MSAFFENLGITIIVDVGKQLVLAIPRAIQNWRFRRFFGSDAVTGDRIFGVLDPVTHPLLPQNNRYVKLFGGRRQDQPLVGPTNVLGICSVRVASYASALFGRFRPSHKPLAFVIDYDVDVKWDASFICFGSSDSNLKTFDIESLSQQKFYSIAFDSSGKRVFRVGNREFEFSEKHDYGILLRMRNPHHPEHALFVCAGLGEWGTSGAAYLLFHNWSSLYWKHGNADFCKVIRVANRSDETAEEVFSIP